MSHDGDQINSVDVTDCQWANNIETKLILSGIASIYFAVYIRHLKIQHYSIIMAEGNIINNKINICEHNIIELILFLTAYILIYSYPFRLSSRVSVSATLTTTDTFNINK